MSHRKERASLLLRVRGKPRFTILAYSLRRVKGHGVRPGPPQEVFPCGTGGQPPARPGGHDRGLGQENRIMVGVGRDNSAKAA
jgi:hypothetical protein